MEDGERGSREEVITNGMLQSQVEEDETDLMLDILTP